MIKYKVTILLVLIIIISVLYNRIQVLKTDRDIYKNNTITLTDDVNIYKIRDSLSAIRVGVLELKISEVKRLNNDYLSLAKDLKIKNNNLKAITSLQTETISKLKSKVIDSIVYIDNVIVDTLKCFKIDTKFFKLNGCIGKNGFEGIRKSYNELQIFQTLEHKRFLGFLWKTNKIKNEDIKVVSLDPETTIVDFKFIKIRK